jgi:hypothetical protein
MGICGACARRQASSIEKKVKFSQVKTIGFSFENLHVADLSQECSDSFGKSSGIRQGIRILVDHEHPS